MIVRKENTTKSDTKTGAKWKTRHWTNAILSKTDTSSHEFALPEHVRNQVLEALSYRKLYHHENSLVPEPFRFAFQHHQSLS
ncbi:MAG: hypothetical protein IPI39_11845 [Candidatus Obscuribacter sp.]|nr:hypothetical protein [Candidatus Obscuribacter sp.]